MPSCMPLKLHPNADWPGIVDRLLGSGTPAEQDRARTTMWVEVQYYVEHYVHLPIGPLREDDEVRRDIALRVLEKLAQRDYQHIRSWRERQRTGEDRASWWGLISMCTNSISIDVARCSRQNIAPRGEPFQWVRELVVDPFVLTEIMGGTPLEHILAGDAEDLRDSFTEFQEAIGSRPDGIDPWSRRAPCEPEPAPTRRRRRAT